MPVFSRFFARWRSQNDPQDNSPMHEAIEPAPPFGLKILADGKDRDLDVVAIHGLDGHREDSWTAKNGTLWLRDLLPAKLPNARIVTYGYNAHTHGQQLTTQYLYDHATVLIANLVLFRNETSTEERPIIFIAHSLGGILLKSALIQLHLGVNSPDRTALASSSCGILFFGTPHRGSMTAKLGSVVLNIQSIFTSTSHVLIRYLKKDSEIIQQQLLQFASISQNFNIKFFYELYPTGVAPGIKIMLVPKDSAVPDSANDMVGFGLYKDHVDMVKFTSATDCDFWSVSRHLLLMARQAITARWKSLRTPDMEYGPTITTTDRARDSRSRLPHPDIFKPPIIQESKTQVYPTATAKWGNMEPVKSLPSEGHAQDVIHGSSTGMPGIGSFKHVIQSVAHDKRDAVIPQPCNYIREPARAETNVQVGIYSLENGRGSYPLTSAACHYQVFDIQVGASLVQNYVSGATAVHEVFYVFPLPQDAAVCSFKAIIDGKRTITGVVKEKAEAKQHYKKAMDTGKTAALLEKHHADIFQVSLGNIKPRQRISIHISFVAMIAHDSAPGSLRLMIPVAIAPRYGSTSPIPQPNSGTTTVYNLNLQVTLSVQMTGPITSITSPTHQIALTFGTASAVPSDPHDPTKAYLSLENETLLEKDIVILIASQKLDHPRCIVERHGQKGTEAYALTLVPQFDLPPLQRQEYIFLVDRSESMGGQRIQAVRTALQIMLRSLPTQDTSFNIWSFGSSYSSLWPISRAYSVHSMREAAAHIDSFDANYGGTEISIALQVVFECVKTQHDSTQDLPKAIFLLTDGEAWDVQGVVSHVRRAVAHAKAKNSLLRTFVLGIGDNVSTPMCEGIARAGNGIAVFVGNKENPEGKLMRLLKAARGGVIGDLAIDWGVGNGEAEADDSESDQDQDYAEPGPNVPAAAIHLFGRTSNLAENQISLGPDRVVVKLPPRPYIRQAPLTKNLSIPLYSGFRCSIFAIIKRDKTGPAPSIVRLTGQVFGRPVVLEVSVTRSTPSPLRDLGDNLEVLHILAARSLIQDMEDLPESDENDAKIIRLATQYSLTTCQTSFFATDEEENTNVPFIPVPSVDVESQAATPILPPLSRYISPPLSTLPRLPGNHQASWLPPENSWPNLQGVSLSQAPGATSRILYKPLSDATYHPASYPSTSYSSASYPYGPKSYSPNTPSPIRDSPVPDSPASSSPVPDSPTSSSPVPESPAPSSSVPDSPDSPAPSSPVPDSPAPSSPAPDSPAPDSPAPDSPAPDSPAPGPYTANSPAPGPYTSNSPAPNLYTSPAPNPFASYHSPAPPSASYHSPAPPPASYHSPAPPSASYHSPAPPSASYHSPAPNPSASYHSPAPNPYTSYHSTSYPSTSYPYASYSSAPNPSASYYSVPHSSIPYSTSYSSVHNKSDPYASSILHSSAHNPHARYRAPCEPSGSQYYISRESGFAVRYGEGAVRTMPPTEGLGRNQAFEGFFMPPALQGVLSEIPATPLALESLSVKQADKNAIWTTLLVIAYMAKYLSAEQAAWELMAEKGMDYVRRVLGDQSVIDVEALLGEWKSQAQEVFEPRE